MLKLRVARASQGRREGYRTIVACVMDERAFFMLGYGKKDLANIGSAMLNELRLNGAELLTLSEDELDLAKAAGKIREIER